MVGRTALPQAVHNTSQINLIQGSAGCIEEEENFYMHIEL